LVNIKPVNFTEETPVGTDFVLWVNATKERKVTVTNFLGISHTHTQAQISDLSLDIDTADKKIVTALDELWDTDGNGELGSILSCTFPNLDNPVACVLVVWNKFTGLESHVVKACHYSHRGEQGTKCRHPLGIRPCSAQYIGHALCCSIGEWNNLIYHLHPVTRLGKVHGGIPGTHSSRYLVYALIA